MNNVRALPLAFAERRKCCFVERIVPSSSSLKSSNITVRSGVFTVGEGPGRDGDDIHRYNDIFLKKNRYLSLDNIGTSIILADGCFFFLNSIDYKLLVIYNRYRLIGGRYTFDFKIFFRHLCSGL